MFKYIITDFGQMLTLIKNKVPVYINIKRDDETSYDPRPYLYGLLLSVGSDIDYVVLMCTLDSNTDISVTEFYTAIINLEHSSSIEIKGKMFNMNNIETLYDIFNNKDYEFFIIDDTFYKHLNK